MGRFETHEDRAYYPAAVAAEMGIPLPSLEDLKNLDEEEVSPPGVDILAGRIPNSKLAGFVPTGEGRPIVFDHAAVSFEGSRLRVMPTTKAAVSSEGNIEHEGAIVLEKDIDLLRLPFFALSARKNFWKLERMRAQGKRIAYSGDLAIFSTLGLLEYDEFEITDKNGSSGLITATRRRQLF